MANTTEKVLSPSLGNGLAYFAVAGITYKTGYTFEDPTMAALMMGAIMGSLLMYVRGVLSWAGGLIEHWIKRK